MTDLRPLIEFLNKPGPFNLDDTDTLRSALDKAGYQPLSGDDVPGVVLTPRQIRLGVKIPGFFEGVRCYVYRGPRKAPRYLGPDALWRIYTSNRLYKENFYE